MIQFSNRPLIFSMNTKNEPHVYEIASGELAVWLEPGGPICLKIVSKFNDPVELAEHEAMELAELLTKLVQGKRR
jgi:hypothetical protein